MATVDATTLTESSSPPGGVTCTRVVTIVSPPDKATIPSGSLSVGFFAVPGALTDGVLVIAYPMPSSPPGVPILADPVHLTVAQMYSTSLALQPNTTYMIAALLRDITGDQKDASVIQVTTET